MAPLRPVSLDEIESIAIGAWILGTGGGGSPYLALLNLRRLYRAGTVVSLSTAAANHDPAAFTAPERFDITVEREPPLTFGGGAHFCLGAHLARAEMQEAIAVLARRLPDLRIDGDVRWRPRTGIFGPTVLPLAFTGELRC